MCLPRFFRSRLMQICCMSERVKLECMMFKTCFIVIFWRFSWITSVTKLRPMFESIYTSWLSVLNNSKHESAITEKSWWTLWQKEKLPIIRNFFFCHNVFKSRHQKYHIYLLEMVNLEEETFFWTDQKKNCK